MKITTIIFILHIVILFQIQYVNTFEGLKVQQQSRQDSINRQQHNININKINININKMNINNRIFPQQGKSYKIGSYMFPGLYLTLSSTHNILKCQPWTNTSNQLFTFVHIKQNKYKIISLQSSKSLSLFQYQHHYEYKFNLKKQQYTQDQIWDISRDIQTEQGYFIKSIIDKQQYYLDVEKVLERYKQSLWSDIKYKHKKQTWIIREVNHKQQMLKSIQQYQQLLAQTYRNISYNYTQSNQYEQWINFHQLLYEFSTITENIPKWLLKYHWSHSSPDMPAGTSRQTQLQGFKVSSYKFNTKIRPNCIKSAQSPPLAYIWVGDKPMPLQYQAIINQCKNTTKVLTMKDMQYYTQKWNQIYPEMKIILENFAIRQVADLLKKLYLYFQSGMYADFDTEINQECFNDIVTDEVIFTNQVPIPADFNWVPEENFMKVNNKFNIQVKKMIQAEIKSQERWLECRNRQCFIVNCQRHLYDRTYFKGYQ